VARSVGHINQSPSILEDDDDVIQVAKKKFENAEKVMGGDFDNSSDVDDDEKIQDE